MVVEEIRGESQRKEGDDKHKGRNRRKRRGRKGKKDSISLDKQQLILIQARQTDADSDDELNSRRLRARPFNTTGYYILDLHAGKLVSTLPRTIQDDNQGRMSSVVAMGSKIYMFGSEIYDRKMKTSEEDEVVYSSSPKPVLSYSLDLTNPQTWERGLYPPLSEDQLRLHGGVAFHDGNIYFFRQSQSSCLFEVFHPQLNHWRRIKSPPGADHFRLIPPVLPDYKNNRIFVFFKYISAIYAYYPSEDRWECVESFNDFVSSQHRVTLADGVIYVHHRKIKPLFRAFHLATKQWLNVRVSPDCQSYLVFDSYDYLFYPGNSILCLLVGTYQDHDPGQPQTTAVHAVQFKIKLIDTKEVLVTPLSSKYCHLDSRCCVFTYTPL